MLRIRSSLLLAAVLLLVSQSVDAQSTGIIRRKGDPRDGMAGDSAEHPKAERRASHRGDSWGGSIGANANPIQGMSTTLFYARDIPVWIISVRAIAAGDLIFSADEDSPYYRDSFDNGQSRCRDSRNGQFASDAYCGPEIDGAIRAELLIMPHPRFGIGGGLRVPEPSLTPYASVQYEQPFGAKGFWFVHGAAGKGFAQFDLGAGMRF
jgi:hypothetical protein